MLPFQVLEQKLHALDGKDYGAYQALKGTYAFDFYELIFEHIPKDPYAPPHTGLFRIRLSRNQPDIISADTNNRVREIAFRDYLARLFYLASQKYCAGRRGTGYSGIITINQPGQAILDRSCVILTSDDIELRCFLGMPAQGRSINAQTAQKMIFDELPRIISDTILASSIKTGQLKQHMDLAEDSNNLRDQLPAMGLVAFIREGAVLPRESGSSQLPLATSKCIPFQTPKNFRTDVTLPNSGKISGMGIPSGITLITGGGYHGKSTLLDAIALGVYDHIPGDGRELCVSHPDTVKIRAYSGRYVTHTNISAFINNLPLKRDTRDFSTDNASGSTSQAAGIIEALEAGAGVLLMDEDTCATNFMSRDQKMQQLVHQSDEPITTFIDRVKDLHNQNGVSTILVLGGSGDYFDVADHVIQMKNYLARDVTEQAVHIALTDQQKRASESENKRIEVTERTPLADSIDATNQYGKKGIYAKETWRIHFGGKEIDVIDLEQLYELSQTRAIAFAMQYARQYMDGKTTLKTVVDNVIHDIEKNGLDILDEYASPNFAGFRSMELAFALNRMRGFIAKQK